MKLTIKKSIYTALQFLFGGILAMCFTIGMLYTLRSPIITNPILIIMIIGVVLSFVGIWICGNHINLLDLKIKKMLNRSGGIIHEI